MDQYSSCPHCDSENILKESGPYGTKYQCKDCGHILKDVERYAGVMVWSHKTAPEIEIHASKKSAGVLLGSSRNCNIKEPVKVVHHAPSEMGGRRDNKASLKGSEPKLVKGFARKRSSKLSDYQIKLPSSLNKVVLPIEKLDISGCKTYTKIKVKDLQYLAQNLDQAKDLDAVCSLLKLRKGKTKKPIALLSWLAQYGKKLPKEDVTVYKRSQNADHLIIEDTISKFERNRKNYVLTDRDTIRQLGFRTTNYQRG